MFTTSRFLMLAAAMMVAVPMAAQQASFDSTSSSAAIVAPATTPVPAAVAVAGPVMRPAGVIARSQAAPLAVMAPPVNGENSQNTALMFVGGAGLIVGALVGGRSGTIVMVGSGILGLVGLFRYLQ